MRAKTTNKTARIESTMEIVRIVASLAIAYGVALLILLLISEDPVFIIRQFVLGPFSSPRRIGSIVNLAIPITITGLSMCFMYAVNRFNLIGESIFMLSACLATYVGLRLAPFQLPMFVMVPLILLVGALIGVVVSYIPAWMDRKFKANVVVVSLMLNSAIVQLCIWILRFQMRDPKIAYIGSFETPASMQLPYLFGKFKIESALFIALLCTVAVALLFFKTSFGWKMRLVGSNPAFASAVGLSVHHVSFIAQLLGGALAGIAGTTELMSAYTRFEWIAGTGHGFDGLLVAVLSKKNPAMVPFGALFLAYIRIGADVVSTSGDIPVEFITVIQGIVILLIAAESFLSGMKKKMIYKAAEGAAK